jgi:putative methyltransferase (TIGR04325 family)
MACGKSNRIRQGVAPYQPSVWYIMSTPLTPVLKIFVPRPLRQLLRRWRREPVYSGDYQTWEEAVRKTRGYHDAAIFEKTLAAARAVRDGKAAWERDSVLFSEPEYNRPLLTALLGAASANGGKLHVVDFGGAFGSTWWQHRAAFAELSEVRWSVVEQGPLVVTGQSEFSSDQLHFYRTLADCCAAEKPSVILLSSVLPYLRDPRALLAEVLRSDLQHMIIDRTGFVARGRDRLTVQRVPKEIYDASYPCWFFDRAALLAPFSRDWRVVAEWTTADETNIAAKHQGIHLEKQK